MSRGKRIIEIFRYDPDKDAAQECKLTKLSC